jgi:hypothetical protein
MPRTTAALIVVALLAVLALGVHLLKRRERDARRRVLAGRTPLDEEALYQQFCGSADVPKESVVEACHRIADLLHVQPGLLRAGDSLDGLGGGASITGDMEAVWELLHREGRPPRGRETLDFADLGAVVRWLATELAAKQPAGRREP